MWSYGVGGVVDTEIIDYAAMMATVLELFILSLLLTSVNCWSSISDYYYPFDGGYELEGNGTATADCNIQIKSPLETDVVLTRYSLCVLAVEGIRQRLARDAN